MNEVFAFPADKFQDYRSAVGATAAWLDASLAVGAWSPRQWDADLDAAATAARPAANRSDTLEWSRLSTLAFSALWDLQHASWTDVFHAIVSDYDPSHMTGPAPNVGAALARSGSTLATRVRVVTFRTPAAPTSNTTGTRTDRADQRHIIAAIVSNTSIQIFDPRTGLFEMQAQLGAGRITAFERHMDVTYGEARGSVRAAAYVLPVVDAYFAWFGLRRLKDRNGSTYALAERPDLEGPARLVQTATAPRPRIKFLCQQARLDDFRRDFQALLGPEYANRIELIAIEDAVSLNRADLDGIDRTVHAIVTRCLQDVTDYAALTRAKDLWSLYVLYRFGGYHLDTGVIPRSETSAVTLPTPPPRRFQPMWVRARDGSPMVQDYIHLNDGAVGTAHVSCNVTANLGINEMTNLWVSHLGLDMRRIPPLDNTLPSFRLIDVGLMRSARGAIGVLRALEVCIRLFGVIDANEADLRGRVSRLDGESRQAWDRRRTERISECYRQAMITAAATGVTHQTAGNRCSFFLPTPGNDLIDPADLGLKKTGGSLHRS